MFTGHARNIRNEIANFNDNDKVNYVYQSAAITVRKIDHKSLAKFA